jgi:hypothetical protein
MRTTGAAVGTGGTDIRFAPRAGHEIIVELPLYILDGSRWSISSLRFQHGAPYFEAHGRGSASSAPPVRVNRFDYSGFFW